MKKTYLGWMPACAGMTLVLLLAAYIGRTLQGPYYWLENIDPSYQYLMSSLNLLEGHSPRHTDHPGTPLQVLGVLVIVGRWGLMSAWKGVDVISDVLQQPESYLIAINNTLMVLLGLNMTVCARRAYTLTHDKGSTLALLLLPFLFFQSTLALWQVTPEPLLLVAMYLTLWVSLPLYVAPPQSASKAYVPIGVALGFGMATKVTFFPWLLTLGLFPLWKDRFKGFGICCLAFVVCTLPILSRYKFMLKWNLTVLQHQGHYGHGGVGLPSLETWGLNILKAFQEVPDFWVMLGSVLALGWVRHTNLRAIRWIVLGAFLQGVLYLKHPGARYLLPALLWLGMGLCLTRPKALYGILGIALGLNLWQFQGWITNLKSLKNQTQAIEALVPGCFEIRSYSLNTLRALQFGNDWNGGYFGPRLRALYPDAIFYEFTHDAYSHFDKPLTHAELRTIVQQHACVMWETYRVDESYRPFKLISVPLPPGLLKLYGLVA